MHILHGHGMANAEVNLGHKVVTNLTSGLDHKGHVIFVDNFFTNVALFQDLERCRIYATGSMRLNRIRLHSFMKDF